MESKSRILKVSSLVILAVQSSAFALVARRSRQPDGNGHVYYAGTAVLFMELSKLLVSTVMLLIEVTREQTSASLRGYEVVPDTDDKADGFRADTDEDQATLPAVLERVQEMVWTPTGFLLIIPAGAFVIQNNLQLIAASYLEPALFQTFAQAKLITTAGFSVLLLGRQLQKLQWLAIAILASGLVVVNQTAETKKADGTRTTDTHSTSVGFVLMMAAALLSGFANVFTEKLLKQDKNFWVTNIHMSFFSLFPSVAVLIFAYLQQADFHMMRGFGSWAWATVLLNAFGGLLVSLVLKYADSIAKGFSLASAVVLTVMVNVLLFGAYFGAGCLIGIATVLVATLTYIVAGSLSAKKSMQSQPDTESQSDLTQPGPYSSQIERAADSKS